MTHATGKPRNYYRAWSRISLRWADNDVYGHVNNTVYYQWFDSAVNAWLIDHKLLDIESGDPIGLVAATSCDYFHPIAYPGEVELGLAIERLGNSSVTYRIGVFSPQSESPAAEGSFVHVYVDRTMRRPSRLPNEWRSVLEQLA